jgi:hypothetical protein
VPLCYLAKDVKESHL